MTKHPERIDPYWPEPGDGDDEHPVSELASPVQGSQMPFGDIELPAKLVRHGRTWRPNLNVEDPRPSI